MFAVNVAGNAAHGVDVADKDVVEVVVWWTTRRNHFVFQRDVRCEDIAIVTGNVSKVILIHCTEGVSG